MKDKNKLTVAEIVAHKWGGQELLREGYIPLPKQVLRCVPYLFRGKRRMTELRVFLAIVDYQRPQMVRYPSLGHLAGMAGVTEDVFRECVRNLKKRKLLTWKGTENAMIFDYSKLLELVKSKTQPLGDE